VLIVAIICLIVAILGGVFLYKARQKNFITTTSVVALTPFVSLIAGICSIVAAICSIISFIHWMTH
jgi:hypothetical protein